MDNEQTNTTDTQGTDPDKPVEKPLSEYDKAIELVKMRKRVAKKEEEILDRKEKLATNTILGGDTGGHVEAPIVSKEETIKKGAKEFFKGTQLEKAIDQL